jgi:hypothetical protein
MKKADIVAAIFLLVTGLMMIFIIIPAQTYPGEEYGVPPATVPTAAMAVVTVMASILLTQHLLARKKNETDTPSPMKRFHGRVRRCRPRTERSHGNRLGGSNDILFAVDHGCFTKSV